MQEQRSLLHAHQQQLFTLFKSLLKGAGKSGRGPVLAFIVRALSINRPRRKMKHDPRACSTDVFLANLCTILLRLGGHLLGSDPLSSLDLRYPLSTGGEGAQKGTMLDYTGVTRLGADQGAEAKLRERLRHEAAGGEGGKGDDALKARIAALSGGADGSAAPADQLGPPSFGFSTHCFFLCHEALDLGLNCSLRIYDRVGR